MATTSAAVVGVLIGAGLAFAMSWALAPAREIGPSVGERGAVSAPAAMGHEAGAAADEGLTHLSERIERLGAAVAAMEKKIDALADHPSTRVIAPDSASGTIDEGSLQSALVRAMEMQNRSRLHAMTADELFAEAERLLRSETLDKAGAKRALAALQERTLKPGEACHVGWLLRVAGEVEASQRTLQGVIDTCPDEETRAAAGLQLIWTLDLAGQPDRAITCADGIARNPAVAVASRMQARLAAAVLAQAHGLARARADFEAIVRDCGDDPQFEIIRNDARQRLGKM